jgi:EAL domain-containing protein (putative c-di-GMP-specific phosphodiesterase class I)
MLKIDGSFITNLINDETDQLLVKSMIDVAHSLGKKVVAEYVENREIMDKLVEYGADYVQGYYIGKPDVSLVDQSVKFESSIETGIEADMNKGSYLLS